MSFDSEGMARQLEEQLRKAQADLAARRVTGESGGGLVRVTVDGNGQVLEVKLDPVCVDARDVKMLEDLVRAATNQALTEARRQVTGGADMGDMLRRFGDMFPGLRGR